MGDAMLNELRTLDVPFFCISKSLVDRETDKAEDEHGPGRPDQEKQGRLPVDELAALQRRMLELLQDLCRE